MRIVIFGLSITSSWGNGHATLWRGLCRSLSRRGHEIVFYEQDRPFYAEHRDLHEWAHAQIRLFRSWVEIEFEAREAITSADVTIITSFCPVAQEATEAAEQLARTKVFYDLDTPVTLSRHAAGLPVAYLPERGFAGYDVVLSYSGGESLERLRSELGAVRVAPLYGSVDPGIHFRTPPVEAYRGELSYLGTYSSDRQEALTELFIEPARRRPGDRFMLGGAQYPDTFPWSENIHFVQHVPPTLHGSFFSSSRWTLNVTRAPMVRTGYCPSGRLFEAAACGAAIITDPWLGVEDFFEPGKEIIVARTADDVMRALDLGEAEVQAIGEAARRRALSCHTAEIRALELESIFEAIVDPQTTL